MKYKKTDLTHNNIMITLNYDDLKKKVGDINE